MSRQERALSWTLRDGMPSSGDAALDELHVRVLTEEPVQADAIVWLQGNGYDRGAKVLALFSDGYAPIVVVTGNRTRSPITVDHLASWLVERSVRAEDILIEAESFHTRDQAMHVLALAQERHWQTLLLVASPHHQLRAFLTFCKRAEEVGWGGRIVNQPARFPWDALVAERDQPACEVFREELMKFVKYREHIATPDAVSVHFPQHADYPSHG